MSWLYSQALAEGFSAATCLDGQPFVQWNVMPTQRGFWRNDKMMDCSRLSQFGVTWKVLTAPFGEGLLMSYREVSPARTLASPEKVQESQDSVADSGKSSHGLLAKYDHHTHSLRTAQLSLFEDSMSFSVTLPRAGTMRSGCVYQQPNVALPISVTASGFLPTPIATDGKRTPIRKKYAYRPIEKDVPDTLAQWIMRESGLEHARLEPPLWEWMMGWPLGWTELKPLETDKFHAWQQQHSLH